LLRQATQAGFHNPALSHLRACRCATPSQGLGRERAQLKTRLSPLLS